MPPKKRSRSETNRPEGTSNRQKRLVLHAGKTHYISMLLRIMKYYELPDRIADNAFLHGQPVSCKVTLQPNQSLQPGEEIIVKLSNGSKYKGKILEFMPLPIGGYQIGEALIIRVQPGAFH